MASYFFVGIGGSGMLPLAEIVRAQGHEVAGSDRALDQGRSADKFAELRQQGFSLHPQDGSGVRPGQIVVASAAIEPTVPDIARANALGLTRFTRAELLAELFNAAPIRIGVGGTSGKSTVTGMIGWILAEAGRDPTIVNGAVMKNFGRASRVGDGEVLVSEVDESDGSIAFYRPTVGVVTNIALDHKPLDELQDLFGQFYRASKTAVVNVDNEDARRLAPARAVTFGLRAGAAVRAQNIVERPDGIDFEVAGVQASLAVPGRHNVSNALAAIAAAQAVDVPLGQAAAALRSYAGSNRRLDVIGTAGGVTVIDDFGHNPDKIAATLTTLHAFPGRLLVLFQPHGYGPLRVMGRELVDSFVTNLRDEDVLLLPDPVYFGGTTDRSVGSADIVAGVRRGGRQAEHLESRDACAHRLLDLAAPGDRIVVMGARDDTLTDFARDLLARLPSTGANSAR